MRRALLGIGGQILNAGTNVATAFVASALLHPDDFGLFVLAFACVTLVLATGRGLIGSTLMAHLPAQEEPARSQLAGSALGFTAAVGVLATAIVALAAIGLPTLGLFVAWVGAALLQDACRYVFLAVGRTGAALVLDLAWAVVQAVVLVGWVVAGGAVTLPVIACAWGAGAVAGVVAFAVLSPVRPRGPRAWASTTRDVAGWFTAIAVIGQAEAYVVLLLAGALLAPRDAGGLRAVQLVTFQPMMVLLGALLTLATPAFARLSTTATAADVAALNRKVTVGLLPVIAGALLVVPLREPIMGLLLPQYLDYAVLVLPIILQSITFALSVPGLALLRGLRQGRTLFWLQVQRLVLVVGLSVVGAYAGGLTGLAWMQALGGLLGLLTTVVTAHRAGRRPHEFGAEQVGSGEVGAAA